MAASYVGIDIGSGSVKVAYRGAHGVQLAMRTLPEHMMDEDDLVAPETLTAIIADMRKQEHIKARNAVLVLGDSSTFFRHVTLPPMSDAELKINLPYEFRDYIDEDPGTYVYDYAVDEIPLTEEGTPERLELYAAAVSKKLVDERAAILRKAGFRLKIAIPSQMAYTRLLLDYLERNPIEDNLHQVFIDIGYEQVTVHLFQGSKFKASKTIDFGCRDLDMAIADIKGVDRHVASTYKNTNFEGVLDEPECLAFYDRLCFEINKVINFYNFSNAEDVERMYLLGGGVEIPQLMDVVMRSFPIPQELVTMVMPPDFQDLPKVGSYALSVAGLLEGEAV